jgi:hypothetical protein
VSQHLFIVSRQQPDLYSYLSREFSGEPEVRVILDRRQGERRQGNGHAGDIVERRQAQRRASDETHTKLASVGYAFVRLV